MHLQAWVMVCKYTIVEKYILYITLITMLSKGFYFWNFRTDVPEAQWSYLLAVERGWIPTGSLESDHIRSACKREDAGEFVCVARSDAKEQYIRPNLEWAMGQLNDKSNIDNLHGEALTKKASLVYNEYWKSHQLQGATCDFGGTAELKYSPTVADDDEFDDGKLRTVF